MHNQDDIDDIVSPNGQPCPLRQKVEGIRRLSRVGTESFQSCKSGLILESVLYEDQDTIHIEQLVQDCH